MTSKTLADFITEARSRIHELSPEALDAMRAARTELLVVDVREPDEYRAAHIPGALLVPRGTLEGAADPAYRHRVHPLYEARRRPIVLYCETGGRSALATDTLNQMGFEEVYNLAGGLNMWLAEDLPIERA